MNLHKYYPVGSAWPFRQPKAAIRAVDGVSFQVHAGETLALVGESGCGKTTTARLLLRLRRPTSGTILFKGADLERLSGPSLRQYRCGVQAVFQDPWSSLNPRVRIFDAIAEPLVVNTPLRGRVLQTRVHELLDDVGLPPAVARNFPHEFSGGQRQRIAVARSLALNPECIVLDEPISALDVSIRAQIMNLLKDLQARHGMSYVLIAHDLATVRYLANRIAVMYLGQVVEQAPSDELFTDPHHPYTRALISAAAAPALQDGGEVSQALGGEVPSPAHPPPGCRFHTRCPLAFEGCDQVAPALQEVRPGHQVACHLYPAN